MTSSWQTRTHPVSRHSAPHTDGARYRHLALGSHGAGQAHRVRQDDAWWVSDPQLCITASFLSALTTFDGSEFAVNLLRPIFYDTRQPVQEAVEYSEETVKAYLDRVSGRLADRLGGWSRVED